MTHSTLSAERQAASGILAPDRQVAGGSALLLFLIFLTVISGLICLYVWQAHEISVIRAETREMLTAADALERANVGLMLEYAGWVSPAYIEMQSNRMGLVTGHEAIRVSLPAPVEPRLPSGRGSDTFLGAWLPGMAPAGFQHR